MKATDKPPQLNIKSYKEAPHISTLNRYLKGAKKKKKTNRGKTQKLPITGAIGTKFRRKEFAERKVEIKLMNDGCWSSFHAFLIRQTPAVTTTVRNNGLIILKKLNKRMNTFCSDKKFKRTNNISKSQRIKIRIKSITAKFLQ